MKRRVSTFLKHTAHSNSVGLKQDPSDQSTTAAPPQPEKKKKSPWLKGIFLPRRKDAADETSMNTSPETPATTAPPQPEKKKKKKKKSLWLKGIFLPVKTEKDTPLNTRNSVNPEEDSSDQSAFSDTPATSAITADITCSPEALTDSAPAPSIISTPTLKPIIAGGGPHLNPTPLEVPKNGTKTLFKEQVKYLGLPNIAETCYMNSTLQSLLTLTPFVQEIHNQREVWSAYHGSDIIRLIADVEKCRSKNNSKMKEDILRMFKSTVAAYNTEFEDDVQNDAHEFLCTVLLQMSSIRPTLENIASSLNSNYTCPVQTHISFEMMNTRQCNKCGHQSQITEDYLNLSLVPNHSVIQGLEEFLKEEQLTYNCECGACDSSQQRSFLTLPNILIIHLQRFEFTTSFTLKKINKAVVLSTNLKLKSDSKSEEQSYKLTGIISHLGKTADFGHYICDGVFQQAGLKDKKDCWLTYNDNKVTETTIDNVCRLRQKTAYLLFYEKQNYE